MTPANTYKNEKIEKTELIPSESYFSIYGFMRSKLGSLKSGEVQTFLNTQIQVHSFI